MQRITNSLSRGFFAILAFGIMLMVMGGKMTITSFMPENDFEDLLEKEPEEGMHIKGEVQYAWDCYAHEETWKENKDGSRTPAKTSHYYYAIPGVGETFFGLEVSVDDMEDMEALADETYEYCTGGAEPSTKVMVEGRMTKMDEEMSGLFKEYLVELGYSNEEIAAMGEFYYIDQPASMQTERLFFAVGAFLVIIAILIFVLRFKKNKPDKNTETFQTEVTGTEIPGTEETETVETENTENF